SDGSPEVRVFIDLVTVGVHDADMRDLIRTLLGAIRELFLVEFVSSFESLGLKPKLPGQAIPRLILAALDGLALHQIFDPPPREQEEEILRGLEAFALSMFEI